MALTIEQFARRVRRFTMRTAVVAEPPLARAARRARSAVRRAIERTDLGRALWKSGKRDAPTLAITGVKVRRPRASEIVADFAVRGMPALIDQGGKTAAHTIQATGSGQLSFRGTNAFAGRIIKADEVRHPGAIVRRQNVVRPAIERSVGSFEGELADAMRELARRSFR